ncbi:MAG TPA: CdaR family protein, partial [Candidatus Gracilibacteria bacterium]|nr:CdaR family protein [Candidatus Gracilibacteria bacterium]
MLKQFFLIGLSFFLAVIFWLAIVSSEQNIKKITAGVPVQIRNLPTELVLTNTLPLLSVKVDTSNEVFQKIDISDFDAYVDFASTQITEDEWPIFLKSSNANVRIVSYEPKSVFLNLEGVREKKVSLEIAYEGRVSPDYLLEKAKLNPSEVILKGSSADLAKVKKTQVFVKLANETQDFTKTLEVKAYDAEGNVVPNLHIDPAKVDLSVVLTQLMETKVVGVEVPVESNLQVANFYLKSLQVIPSTLKVKGDKKLLDALTVIKTD